MADPTTVFRISAVVEGADKVAALNQTIKLLANSATPASDAVEELARQAIQLGTAFDATEKQKKTAISSLIELRKNVQANGEAYKTLSNQIQSLKGLDYLSASAVKAKSRLEDLRRTMKAVGSGFAEFSRNPTALTDNAAAQAAIDKSIQRNRAKRGLVGAAISDTPFGPEAPSELFRSIGAISNQTALNATQAMGGSYERVAQSIRTVSAASDGSLRSLQAQKAAWENLRATIGPMDAEYAQIERESRRAIVGLDKQINQRSIGGQGRLQKFGQTAGAVAASGVFGGPEGFLGSAIGSVGGLPGALAGGAIGAQVGMVRQQIGGTADYAATIGKLEIALKGVTKTQSEYERALAAAARATTEFNVPQQEALQGITKLSAAVIGSGGKVADAEVAFKNITAAIKATGGGAEQVEGALTAATQVFSKGKVQAEELLQIAERLPGTVTMFAKATGRSLPELAKDFEQGKVGLQDFMNFVTSPEGLAKFPEIAKLISSSSKDAGSRLANTWNEIRLAIGKAIQPIGAEIQDSLGKLLKELAPALITTAKALAAAIKFVVDNFGAIANITKFLAVMGLVKVAMGALPTVMGQARIGLALLGAQFGKTTAQATFATGKLNGLKSSLLTLGKIGLVTVGVNLIVNGLEQFNKVKSQVQALKDYDPASNFEGASRETVNSARIKAQKDLDDAQKNLKDYQKKKGFLRFVPGAEIFEDYNLKVKGFETSVQRAQKTLDELNPLKFKPQSVIDKEQLLQLTDYAALAGAGEDKEGNRKAAKDTALKDAQNLALQTAEAQRKYDNEVFQNQIELDRKRYELRQELIDLQAQNEIESLTGVSKEYASRANELRIQLRTLFREGAEAAQNEAGAALALRGARSVQNVAAVSGTPTTGIIARTGNTGDSTGAHLDLRWGDGRPITKADADKYFLVNGRAPSSFGVTSPYGPRRLFGRSFHAGIDFGTPDGSGLSLKGGATFSRNLGNTGAGGYAIEVMTPEGTMKALHLMANSVNVSGGSRQQIRANAVAGTEASDLQRATGMRRVVEESIQPRAQELVTRYVEQNTAAVRNQIEAIADENQINRERYRLQLEGFRPEQIEREIDLLKTRQTQIKETASAQALLAQKEEQLKSVKDPEEQARLKLEIDAQKKVLQELPGYYEQLRTSIIGASEAQIAFNDAQEKQQQLKEVAGNIVNTITTGIGQIFDGLFDKSKSFMESLGDVAKNIFKDLARQIFSVGVIEPLKNSLLQFANSIIQKISGIGQSSQGSSLGQLGFSLAGSLLGAAAGGIGGGGGLGASVFGSNSTVEFNPLAFTGGFQFANGGIMSADGSIPLKRYAKGGIATRPQLAMFGEGSTPEAYVPLPDGRRIPVALKGDLFAASRNALVGPAGANGEAMDQMGGSNGASPSRAFAANREALSQSSSSYRERYVERLISSGASSTEIKYSRVGSGDLPFVTEEDMLQASRIAAQEGAKLGQQRTLAALKNNPGARRSIGI